MLRERIQQWNASNKKIVFICSYSLWTTMMPGQGVLTAETGVMQVREGSAKLVGYGAQKQTVRQVCEGQKKVERRVCDEGRSYILIKANKGKDWPRLLLFLDFGRDCERGVEGQRMGWKWPACRTTGAS
jgi:hypothetical protein